MAPGAAASSNMLSNATEIAAILHNENENRFDRWLYGEFGVKDDARE